MGEGNIHDAEGADIDTVGAVVAASEADADADDADEMVVILDDEESATPEPEGGCTPDFMRSRKRDATASPTPEGKRRKLNVPSSQYATPLVDENPVDIEVDTATENVPSLENDERTLRESYVELHGCINEEWEVLICAELWVCGRPL